jgi:hypothetical protein
MHCGSGWRHQVGEWRMIVLARGNGTDGSGQKVRGGRLGLGESGLEAERSVVNSRGRFRNPKGTLGNPKRTFASPLCTSRGAGRTSRDNRFTLRSPRGTSLSPR